MNIIGINCYHANSSAALIVDGRVIFAIEEERLNRVKNSGGFPHLSIKECLKYKKINLDNIDFIAINTNPKKFITKKIIFGLKNLITYKNIKTKITDINKKLSILDEINKINNFGNFKGKVINVEHHKTHIASAFYMSKFNDAIGISIDGSGDFTTTSWANCKGTNIEINNRIYYPHSLGIFYTAITNYLGFNTFGEEYKVMALAALGNSNLNNKLSDLIKFLDNGQFELNLDYFLHHKKINTFSIIENKIIINELINEELFADLIGFRKRERDTKLEQMHFDLAYSLQNLFEKAYFNYINASYNNSITKNLCIAGGCAMNSVANGKLLEKTKFKKIFIQPAAYDAGGAIGAALSVYYDSNKNRDYQNYNLYLGPEYSNIDVEKAINTKKNYLDKENIKFEDFTNKQDDLLTKIVDFLMEKKIVGIFKGRVEWGARALGNRSIIADPRGEEIKDIMNRKIKRRESFRPFAPIILYEYLKDWFYIDREISTMMEVHKIKDEKKNIIPAVVHVDDTCRLQTLKENDNKFIYKLISEFNRQTEIPILLNTSFNENEPIVCKPEEAINTFIRTDMDALLLENYLLYR